MTDTNRLYAVWDRVAALHLTGDWPTRKRQVLDIIAEERSRPAFVPPGRMSPTTKAGRWLLDYVFMDDDDPGQQIAAIEAEARAALLAELEAGVEGLLDPRHGGPPLADDLIERAAVLDLIRKAGEK